MASMSFVLDLVLGSLFEGLMDIGAASRARRRFTREGIVQCSVRAVEGRILNIPTEWSYGTAVISQGQVLFHPAAGIVGERRIAIERIGDSAVHGSDVDDWFRADMRVVRATTSAGELLFSFPTAVVDEVVAAIAAGTPV